MQCTSKQMKFLNALRDYEVNKTIFSPQELADITGYSTNSVTKYINEKLNGIYVYSFGDKKFKCDGIGKLSNNDFALLMSQSLRAKRLTQDEILHKNLMKRSLDAFTLSLEVYNRPSLENRVEAFCIFAINAWELMLKAEIIKFLGAKAAFYDDKKSLTVRDAIKLRLNERDPVCHNLETLIELRDNAIHLLIPELQPELSRLFQANVLNYEQRYASEMGNSPFSGQSVGLLSLVIDSPLNEVALIKDNYGELTAEAASRFLEKFHKNAEELQSN